MCTFLRSIILNTFRIITLRLNLKCKPILKHIQLDDITFTACLSVIFFDNITQNYNTNRLVIFHVAVV